MISTQEVRTIQAGLKKAYEQGNLGAFNALAMQFLDGVGLQLGNGNVAYKSSITQEPLANIVDTTKPEVEELFRKAEFSQRIWAALPLHLRQKFFTVLEKHMKAHEEHFRVAISLDMGKADGPASTEMVKAFEWIKWANSDEVTNTLFKQTKNGDNVTIETRKPAGVCAGMTSANYPLGLFMGPFVTALLTGSAYVYKAGEKSPTASVIMKEMVSLALNEMRSELVTQEAFAGNVENFDEFVDGLYGVAQGFDKEAVKYFVQVSDFLTFIGSDVVGKFIEKDRTKVGKQDKTILELGGFSPVIVRESVFEEKTPVAIAAEVFKAATDNSGQRCTGVRVVFLENNKTTNLLPLLQDKYQNHPKTGNPFALETAQGPMIYANAADKMNEVIESAIALGAKVVTKPNDRKNDGFEKTCLINPAMLVWPEEAINDSKVIDFIKATELFCPLTHVFTYNRLEQAIDVCKQLEFKLAGAIYTNNAADVEAFAQIGLGEFNVNTPPKDLSPNAGHGGGVARSGKGRLGGTASLTAITEDGQSMTMSTTMAQQMTRKELGQKGKSK